MFLTWIEMSKFITYDRVFCAIEDDIFEAVKSPESFPLYISAHLEHTETGADLHLDAHLPGEPR